MDMRSLALDVIGHPRLLPARESVRGMLNWSVGARRRVLRPSTPLVPGLLSVVVPMYGVERFIREALNSLSRQNYRNIEIIVVDDGSPDDSLRIARTCALLDLRIRIVRQENGGLSSARNTGIRYARGEYLAFLDSDDFVDRHAYSDAIATLAATGSDFTVSPYRRAHKGTFPAAAPWIMAAHRQNRLHCTLEDFPDILVNAVAWSKVYKRSFWDAAGLTFPEGLLYEDQAVSASAFAQAETFDVLSRVSINWRIRDDQTSITQQIAGVRNVRDHTTAVRDSLDVLEAHDHHEAKDVRLAQVLNNNLSEFLPEIRRMDSDAWAAFTDFVRYLADSVSEQAIWGRVESRKKVLIELVRSGNRDLALRFLEAGGWERDHFAATIENGRLLANFPLRDELAAVVPARVFTLSASESSLRSALRSVTWDGSSQTVTVEFVAYIDRLAPPTPPWDVKVSAVDRLNGDEHPLSVQVYEDSDQILGHTRRYADMSGALVRAAIPVDVITGPAGFTLTISITAGDISRTGSLISDDQSPAIPGYDVGDAAILDVYNDDETVVFAISRPAVRLVDARDVRDSLMVELESDLGELAEIALVRDDDRFQTKRSRAALTRLPTGRWVGQLRAPLAPSTNSPRFSYALEVRSEQGAWVQAHLLTETRALRSTGTASTSDLARRVFSMPVSSDTITRTGTPARLSAGAAIVVQRRSAAVIDDVTTSDDGITISIHLTNVPPGPVHAVARIGSRTIDTSVRRSAPDSASITLPFSDDAWGLGPRALPSGQFALEIRGGRREIAVDVDDEFRRRMPVVFVESSMRVQAGVNTSGTFELHVEPPLAPEERGQGNQWRLKDWFYTLAPSEPRSVLFRNLYGEAVNDSALAVHQELQARGSDLKLIWAVKDRSIQVPDGAHTVIENSRVYFEAFGSAAYAMVNVHQPDWYRKPDGQVLIQTFHGYPFKLNGRRWWSKLGFAAERQESFYRRAEEWDYLVSPARYATPFLKEFYRPGADVQTEILEIGYPRNDVLLGPAADGIRHSTRERLGIRPDQTAILYAPTFRDYLSADDMSAAMVDFLDYADLARRLGPDYVLLLRGHPFNARSGIRMPPEVRNVTDYPDINHLILASDAAVLDYSSLRFDYALAGKPTFFYVPDLERYFRGRESFADYGATTPGPLVRSPRELLNALKEPGANASRYEAARAEFISTFMELEDGQATRRLVDAVFSPRGDA